MKSDLQELGLAWTAADRPGDVSTLDSVLAEDGAGVGPRGFVLTRQQWIERYAFGELAHRTLSFEPTDIRLHGPAAVTIGVQSQESTCKGQPMNGKFRVTQIFVNERGRWWLEGVHLSPLADVPPSPR